MIFSTVKLNAGVMFWQISTGNGFFDNFMACKETRNVNVSGKELAFLAGHGNMINSCLAGLMTVDGGNLKLVFLNRR